MPPTDDVIKKIQLRGHWRVVIRPTEFDAQRVPDIATLFDIVRQTSVELRGWDFPHVDLQEAPRIGHDYVEQALDWSGFVEVWRLYQSGQFYFLGAMNNDWSEEHWASAGQPTASGPRLPATSTVFQYTEFFEFAARLALTAAGAPRMSVAMTTLITASARAQPFVRMSTPATVAPTEPRASESTCASAARVLTLWP